jgi:hypothetical protein
VELPGQLVAESFTWWFPAGQVDFERGAGDAG